MDEIGLVNIPMYIRDHFPVATVSLIIGGFGAGMIYLLVRFRVNILKDIISTVESMIDRFKR